MISLVKDEMNPKHNRDHAPIQMPVRVENIPSFLKEQRRWLNWHWKWNGKKWDKPPYRATSTDPNTWTSIGDALGSIPANGGIGFAIDEHCGLVGVDIDNCRDPVTGELNTFAQNVLDTCGTYAEVSPSATGIKMWFKIDDTSILQRYRSKNSELGLEMYYKGRYFTVTGHIVGEFREVAAVGPNFHALMMQHMPRDTTPVHVSHQELPDDPSRTAELAIEALGYCNPDCNYPEWIETGMALHWLGPQYFSLWDDWSSGGGSYPGTALCKKHWDSFPGKGGKVTIGTLFHYAKVGGYVMPPRERIKASTADPRVEAKYIAKYTATQDGVPTILVYRDEAMRWRPELGRYATMRDSEYRALIANTADLRLTHILPGNVSAIRDHYTSLHLLDSRTELPHWRNDCTWSPRECFATVDRVVHLPSFVAGDPLYSLPATPAFVSTNATDYNFHPTAPDPQRWLNFMDEIFAGDQQQIDLLQMWAGYCLTEDTSQQKMVCMIGPMRSGKGQTMRTLTEVLGSGNVVGPTLASLAGEFGMQQLLHKSLAIIADARLSGRSDSATITERLLAITGEDSISINRKNLTHVTARLPTRIMIVSNELPALKDSSSALANRMLVLETQRSFLGSEDHSLSAALSLERSGILLWCIEGWRKLRAAGRFTNPSSTARFSVDLAELSSPIQAFVTEECELDPMAETPKQELYHRYCQWCDGNGHRHRNSSMFARDLKAAYPRVEKSRRKVEGGQRGHFFKGIKLTPLFAQVASAEIF